MISFDEFVDEFMQIQGDILRDHGDEAGHMQALCKVMHRELGLTETYNAEMALEFERLTGMESGGDGHELDLTTEHGQLHSLLKSVARDALIAGLSSDGILASMFIIGRRYGMREAAKAMGGSWDDIPTTTEG